MPNWISKMGKWFPRKEYAVDPKAPRGKEVYEGPDRAALEVLKAEGVEFLGKDYHMEPDLIRASREMGYKTVDEFLKEMYGFNPAEAQKAIDSLDGKIIDHESREEVQPTRNPSGGDDTSGKGQHLKGGFGDPEVVKEPQLKKRAASFG